MAFLEIKKLRQDKQMTQEELAEKSGVSRNLIARMESGDLKNTTIATADKLAKALGVKISDIFFTTDV